MIGATLGVAVLGALYRGARRREFAATQWSAGCVLAYFGGAIVEIAGALIALAFIRGNSMEQKSR